jgi:hypothetical protein
MISNPEIIITLGHKWGMYASLRFLTKEKMVHCGAHVLKFEVESLHRSSISANVASLKIKK